MHEATARSWAQRSSPPRDPALIRDKIEPGFTDPDGSTLIADMDAAGVDHAMVMTLDHGVAFGEEAPMSIEQLLAHYAELRRRWAPRLRVFANVDPRRPNAEELLTHAFDELGFDGLKIYPNGYFVSDERCRALLAICQRRNLPVLVHTAMLSHPIQGYYANPALLADTQHRFPDLTLIFGHAGAPIWLEQACLTAAGSPNSYLELSHWTRLAASDPDRLVQVISRARDAVGPRRLLFASDHTPGPRYSGPDRSPLPTMIAAIRQLPQRGDFTSEEVELILGGNAARLLGLDLAAPVRAERPTSTREVP
jgi:predicted TIM-barrel fold metal-dependent hydrolase